MEVKVCVDGVARVVCGITEETTCQEVVTALAQALGQPGRYMLRERFKEFERCMTPSEHLLETLKKYGEQAREVQLTLLHGGASAGDEMSRTSVGRHQPWPPLRRKEAGGRPRRGSGSLSLHRQSLPPLPCSTQDARPEKEELKKPKRKSLTLMEEAWEWLESLGRSRVYSTSCDEKADKRKRASLSVGLPAGKEGSRGKSRGQRSSQSDLDHQTSCCMGGQPRVKDGGVSGSSCAGGAAAEEQRNGLRETIIHQLGRLQDLQAQMWRVDRAILELEERRSAREGHQEAHREARRRGAAAEEEELEQIKFWENELKSEEGYERELRRQFLETRAQLEERRRQAQAQGLGSAAREDAEITAAPSRDANQPPSELRGTAGADRKSAPGGDVSPPPCQIRERRPTGPTELREWWSRWSEAQSAKSQSVKRATHRSELTIYLASAKV